MPLVVLAVGLAAAWQTVKHAHEEEAAKKRQAAAAQLTTGYVIGADGKANRNDLADLPVSRIREFFILPEDLKDDRVSDYLRTHTPRLKPGKGGGQSLTVE